MSELAAGMVKVLKPVDGARITWMSHGYGDAGEFFTDCAREASGTWEYFQEKWSGMVKVICGDSYVREAVNIN